MNNHSIAEVVVYISNCIEILRSSLRALAKIHLEEGIVFKSQALVKRIIQISEQISSMILDLLHFIENPIFKSIDLEGRSNDKN